MEDYNSVLNDDEKIPVEKSKFDTPLESLIVRLNRLTEELGVPHEYTDFLDSGDLENLLEEENTIDDTVEKYKTSFDYVAGVGTIVTVKRPLAEVEDSMKWELFLKYMKNIIRIPLELFPFLDFDIDIDKMRQWQLKMNEKEISVKMIRHLKRQKEFKESFE